MDPRANSKYIELLIKLVSLLFLFTFIRLYYFFNIAYSVTTFDPIGFISTFVWGLRFDICILGFLSIPVVFLMWFEFFLSRVSAIYFKIKNQKIRSQKLINLSLKLEAIKFYFSLMTKIYGIICLYLVIIIYCLNANFFQSSKKISDSHWLRSEQYLEIIQKLNPFEEQLIKAGSSNIQDRTTNSILILFILIFGVLYSYLFISKNRFMENVHFKNKLMMVLITILIFISARGKLGQHHIRFEDSKHSKIFIYNELTLNPVWLIDKSLEQLSQ